MNDGSAIWTCATPDCPNEGYDWHAPLVPLEEPTPPCEKCGEGGWLVSVDARDSGERSR